MGKEAPLKLLRFFWCRDWNRWSGIPAGTIAMIGLRKQGDAELRRLLQAAMTVSRAKGWQEYYQSLLQRGLKTTEALVILARNLARNASALMKNQSQYREGPQWL